MAEAVTELGNRMISDGKGRGNSDPSNARSGDNASEIRGTYGNVGGVSSGYAAGERGGH